MHQMISTAIGAKIFTLGCNHFQLQALKVHEERLPSSARSWEKMVHIESPNVLYGKYLEKCYLNIALQQNNDLFGFQSERARLSFILVLVGISVAHKRKE